MSMSFAQYQRIVAEWRIKYAAPPPVRNFRLTVESIACVKKGCGSLKRTQRHHTGNDFWFACLMPDHFAARYIQFHVDDTARLCSHHHAAVHKLYKSIMRDVWKELNEGGQKIITKEWCEKWMAEFRRRFKRWVNTPAKKKRHKRRRRGSTIEHEKS